MTDDELKAAFSAPDDGWLCSCGNWQDDPLHCNECGNSPSWGCGCSFCQSNDDDGGWELAEEADFWEEEYP